VRLKFGGLGQHGVVEEDAKAIEVGAQAVQNDDVRGDQQEVA
jgi:predicted RNA-binding protein